MKLNNTYYSTRRDKILIVANSITIIICAVGSILGLIRIGELKAEQKKLVMSAQPSNKTGGFLRRISAGGTRKRVDCALSLSASLHTFFAGRKYGILRGKNVCNPRKKKVWRGPGVATPGDSFWFL